MNPVARFETFVERLMERTFLRPTRTTLQPVDIGKRLVRALEAHQSVGLDGVIVPNVYDVFLSPADFDHFKPVKTSLSKNMEAHLGRVARQRRFQMVSHPVVRLASDARLEAGDLRVEPHLRDLTTGERVFEHTSILPQVSDPVAPVRATPNLVLDGQQYTVLRSPARVGRLPDNDIVLNDKRVSRHHAQVVNRGNRWVLRDTGSTNGTAVNGKIVEEAVLKPGDTISLGGLEVTWEE